MAINKETRKSFQKSKMKIQRLSGLSGDQDFSRTKVRDSIINLGIKKILKKQHYEIVGNHSAVQICRWTKKSLRDEGVCYKEKFYGIKSHLCCQMTPSVVWCDNKCLHCWRAIELTLSNEIDGEIDSPKKIIDGCIIAQRKLLQGFKIDSHGKKKQLSRANQKKYIEAQEPMQFAISLSGEPTIYKNIGKLVEELRKRGKTSFIVKNGLHPEKIKEMKEKKVRVRINFLIT